MACEPGATSPCACTDGTMGTQTCEPDGSGLGTCECGDVGTSTVGATGDSGGGTTTTGGPVADGTSTGGDTAATDGTTGAVGMPPTAQINHPGDGEARPVDIPIPFIGVGNDAEDGALTGMSLVWTSDVEGQIGTGEAFDAPLTMLGMHVITLEVTDSDGNTAQDSVTLDIVP